VNEKQLQRMADREKEKTRLRRELKKKRRRDRRWRRTTLLTIVAVLVFLGIFAARVTPVQVDGGTSTDPTTVSFHDDHADWLEKNYQESVENAFCLFGRIQGDKVVVEQVEFINNPFQQSHGSMWFTCIPQILARWKPLVFEEEYKLVGAIHTHPETEGLSRLDRETFRIVDDVIEVFGVYNGDRLSMYSSPDQGEPVTSVLQTR